MKVAPFSISILFVVTTVLAVFLFCKASRLPGKTLLILLSWLALQGIVGYNEFYADTKAFPPRFLLLVLPPMLLILLLFVTKSGKRYIDRMDSGILTALHIVRIPVEVVLYLLFLNKAVPQLMTFEGRNFDVFSGLSAGLVYYFGYVKKTLPAKVILFWNVVCLCLLLNIVVIAILSAPFPFQQFAFDQPNIAVLYFPFVWLPGCLVPLVLLSHLICIRHLIFSSQKNSVNHLFVN